MPNYAAEENVAEYLLLAEDPLVLYVPPWRVVRWSQTATTGKPFLTRFARALRHRPVTWISLLGWYAVEPYYVDIWRQNQELLRAELPKHRLILATNTYQELHTLTDAGFECIFAPHNDFCSAAAFYPVASLDDRPFAAVYNARFREFKRHYLLAQIPKLLLLADSFNVADPQYIEQVCQSLQQPYIMNLTAPEAERNRLPAATVNECYNRASCGLAVSAVEGGMLSCTEYLLAGLPVVTTLNYGGRDHHLDGRFSAHVPDDPAAIAEAVQVFQRQKLEPEFIRAETIRKQQAGRTEFARQVSLLCRLEATAVLARVEKQLATGARLTSHSVADAVKKLT